MAPTDVSYIFYWWTWIFAIGVLFLPITFTLFSKFFDKGYIFSRILGIIFISYLAMSIGTLHILQFNIQTLLIITIFFGIINIFFIAKPSFILSIIRTRWKIFLFEELLFIAGLFFLSYLRATQPDIHGLEKYMDFGFINSILRSKYFPPADMWYPPFPINYYYFGHFVTAVLTRLSGIPAFITFNLMLGTILGFCFTGAFSITANLIYLFLLHQEILSSQKKNMQEDYFLENDQATSLHRRKFPIIIGGILAGLIISFAGNLHTIYTFFKPYPNESPVPFWKLAFSPQTFPNNYWYPNATRFIYHTIHEFPMYSFVVSDLHGHVLDIPFVLLTIAILFSFFIQSFGTWQLSIKHCLFVGFLLAIMYMTNAWDGAIYFLFTALLVCYIEWKRVQENKRNFLITDLLAKLHLQLPQGGMNAVIGIITYLLITAISFLFFSLPFSLYFSASSIAHGIGVLCAPKFLTNIGKIGPFLFEVDHCQKSPLWQVAILHGFFYFFVLVFLLFIFLKKKTFRITIADVFVTILICLSTALIIIPEFFYLKDIYPTYYRANTMFKLVYQSFLMLSISSAYITIRVFHYCKRYMMHTILDQVLFGFWTILFLGLFSLVSIYPYYAINAYYNLQTYSGLNGITYLQKLYPTDYDAIIWLNSHITGQPIILEAQGDSYTDFARVSTNTGLPTPLGWTVHEWLWRGSYDPLPQRINDIKSIYESADIPTVKSLVKKYNISLIFVGVLERQKYSIDTNKFEQLGQLIYHNGQTSIYIINQK